MALFLATTDAVCFGLDKIFQAHPMFPLDHSFYKLANDSERTSCQPDAIYLGRRCISLDPNSVPTLIWKII